MGKNYETDDYGVIRVALTEHEMLQAVHEYVHKNYPGAIDPTVLYAANLKSYQNGPYLFEATPKKSQATTSAQVNEPLGEVNAGAQES